MPYSGLEIMGATGGTLVMGRAGKMFADVSTETRDPQSGKLFVPLKGQRFDGHAFISTAVRNGAAGLLIKAGEEERLREIKGEGAVTVISVPETLTALGDISRFWRSMFQFPVVAITGSA